MGRWGVGRWVVAGGMLLAGCSGSDGSAARGPCIAGVGRAEHDLSVSNAAVTDRHGWVGRLLSHTGAVTAIDITPDGRLVAFTSAHGGSLEEDLVQGLTRLYVRGVAPSARARALPVADPRSFSWSPDGRRIAYISGDGPSARIGVIDADGRHDRTVVRWPGAVTDLRALEWSPTADEVVVALWGTPVRGEAGSIGSELWTVEVASGARRRVASLRSTPLRLVWSPDGRWVGYADVERSDFSGPTVIRAVDVRDGTVRTAPRSASSGSAVVAWTAQGLLHTRNRAGAGDRLLAWTPGGADRSIAARWPTPSTGFPEAAAPACRHPIN